MDKNLYANIMISNAESRNWVLKELVELQEIGEYNNMNKVLLFYLDIFQKNNIAIEKFKDFSSNFKKTYKEEIA